MQVLTCVSIYTHTCTDTCTHTASLQPGMPRKMSTKNCETRQPGEEVGIIAVAAANQPIRSRKAHQCVRKKPWNSTITRRGDHGMGVCVHRVGRHNQLKWDPGVRRDQEE